MNILTRFRTFFLAHKKLVLILGILLIIGVVLWNIFGPKQVSTQYQTAQSVLHLQSK